MKSAKRKNHSLITLAAASMAIFLHISCSSGSFKLSDRWEGIEKGILRIYIKDEIPDPDGFDSTKEKKMWESLEAKGKDRAIHLLLSHIRSLTADPRKYSLFDDRILKSLEKSVMVFRECSDEYCEAFIDYRVKELIDSINGALKGAGGGK